MNIKEIVSGMFYVGVNDRVTQLFEGLWPLPLGVSYNSYLVRGSESTALIDTVRIDEAREFLSHLAANVGSEKIDYVVINHMEPDHSGAIPLVLERWPDARIIGNAQTISMIADFYHITDAGKFIEIKDGQTLDLGGKTLRFHLTPMVHWPETMMTYVPEDKVLFSGDAFGCFGALNGGVTDAEMDTSPYFPEMYRYYSNIVGKYGTFVQRALTKLMDVPLDFICPTHGPVWHKRIGEVVGLTGQLSSYTPEAGVTIVYGSMYGNTAELAEETGRQLAALGVKRIRIHNASTASMSDMISDAFRYEGLIVGSATYSMRVFPPVEAFLQAMETREIKNKVFASFCSYTWARNPVAARMNEFAAGLKLETAAQVIMNRSMNDSTASEARAMAEAVCHRLTLK